MHNDISLLKKAMADTGREMSEVTDKVAQLRRIARLENNNIKQLKIQMYNVTVSLLGMGFCVSIRQKRLKLALLDYLNLNFHLGLTL